MNLKTVLLLAGAAAAGIVALSAAAVLTGPDSSSGPPPAARSGDTVVPDEPAPDPAASGIIIVTSDQYHYWLDPEGKYGSVSQWRYPESGVSADGRWLAGINWDDDVAFLTIFDRGNPDSPDNPRDVHFPASLVGAEWAPNAPLLAAQDEDGLYLVDPASGEATQLTKGITAYAWAGGDRLIYATQDGAGAVLYEADIAAQSKQLAALSGPVDRFYVSPERDQVLYAQDDSEGWRLLSLDPASGAINDYGNLGRAWMKDYSKPDRSFTTTTKVTKVNAPELAVAWSPGGKQIAIGPVDAPYVMYLIDPHSKVLVRSYSFEEGYAGELSWSPDGTRLAISTYSPDRTRHEVYVMDVASGGAPRHLLDGCKIVWSPDSRFVAVKREPHDATGVAAIRVETGYHWALSQSPQFIPVSWGEDQQTAVALAAQPLPYAVQLGK